MKHHTEEEHPRSAFGLQKCVTDEPACVMDESRLDTCVLCGVFAEAQSRVNEVFSRTRLQDLLQTALTR